jgi:tetratricopeptide (TPR) repeat protein
MLPVLNEHRYRRVWFTIAALLAVDLARVSGQAPARDSNLEYDRGVRLQQAGDLAGARQAYEAALQLSPRRMDALSNLGLVYSGLRQYDRAVQSFKKALEIDPRQPAVLFNLGLTYLQAGQNENARRTLASVVGTQDSNFAARHYLGVSLLKLGRTPEGIAELEIVAGGHPEDLDALYTLASAYLKNNQLEAARQLIDSKIIAHDTAEAHLIAGSYYMAAHSYRQAVDELRRAQQLNPELSELGSRLGGAYAMTGGQDLATQQFEDYLKKNPSDYDSLAFLGWLYLESDRVDEAEAMLNRAHKIRPNDLEVVFQLARVARARQHFEEALGLLERVIAANPDHVRAHVLLAQTYFHLKRTADGNREREIVKRLSAEEEVKNTKETGIAAGTHR